MVVTLAGLLLLLIAALLWCAPVAVMIVGDKFFLAYFWWAKDYPMLSMLGGAVGLIVGIIVLMEGSTSDEATEIPPRSS